MMQKVLKPAVFALLMAAILAGCSVSEKQEIQTLFGYALGTSYSVKMVAGLNESRGMHLGLEGVLSDINDRMSTYLPTSDVSRFASLEVGERITVDSKTIEVVSSSLDIARLTDGAFDPTVAPLVDLWGFGPTARNATVPEPADISDLIQQVGYEEVVVDSATSTLTKSAQRSLDLSAIAKGYAVDLIAEYLESNGIQDYLVEVGGEMRFSGVKPTNEPWRIAVEKPIAEERSPFQVLTMVDGAIATSGDYRNFFEVDGKRYSHTIDPKTGYPVEHDLASVTVFAKSCMEADALATAFSVLGREDTLALAEANEIAVFLIYEQDGRFETAQSSMFTSIFGQP